MAIEYQGTVNDGGGNALTSTLAIDVINIGGKLFAVLGGADGRLDVYEIDTDPASPTYGELSATPVDTVVDDASLNLNVVRAIESMEINGIIYVFAGGSDNGISSFTLDSSGQLTSVDNATDTGPINMEQVTDLSTASIDDGAGGTNHFVFVVSDGAGDNSVDDDGISVFQVAADGTMTNVDNVIADGTNRLNNPQDIEAVQVSDGVGGFNTFVVAGGNQDGLSVFSVASDGTLTLTDNVLDDATLSLENVRSIEGFEIDGTSYIAVGADEGGVSFFEIDAAGTLTHVGTTPDDGTLNLFAIDDIYIGDYQGLQVLWVAGRDAGLDAYEIVLDGATGQISLTRLVNFDSTTYETSDLRALDGDSGFIVTGDSDGSSLSSFTAPPCFTPGTLILTPDGERPVEELKVGDLVVTRDRGNRPIRHIAVLEIRGPEIRENWKPILISAGSLAPGLPRRDLVISGHHRMLLSWREVSELHDTAEVLAPAKGLVALPGVRIKRGVRHIRYIHLLFDRHEVLSAEGAPTESFYPGSTILREMSKSDRQALFDAIPEMRNGVEAAIGKPARKIIRVKETEKLVRRHRSLKPELGHVDKGGFAPSFCSA